jgi:prevent-host-death family protein
MQKKKVWPVQDAKARFSELLDACERDGPQIVSRRGHEAAVLVPIEEWKRLREAARPSLKSLLLSDSPRVELPLPIRGRARRRGPPNLL